MQYFEPEQASLVHDENSTVAPDRRQHHRQITILRLAKIKCASGEGWGFIKNLSTTGMMLEVHSDFDVGHAMSIILSDDHCLSARVKWRNADSVGVGFLEPVDISEVLKISKVMNAGKTPRLPRVTLDYPIQLRVGIRSVSARICDISPAGICVQTTHRFELGKKITLLVPQLGEISGTVKWHLDDRVGISFEERLSVRDLMAWLSTQHGQAGIVERDVLGSKMPTTSIVQGASLLASTSYNIIGVDHIGREISMATLASADDAMLHYRTTSKYFERVIVTNENGVELSFVTLKQDEMEQQSHTTTLLTNGTI